MLQQPLGHRPVALMVGIAVAPGVPQPVHPGDLLLPSSTTKLGPMSRRNESSCASDNVPTPVPVVSETSATFFGLAMKVTGSNCAIALAASE